MEYFEELSCQYVGEPPWPANQMKKPPLQFQSITTITGAVGKAGPISTRKFI